MVKLSRTRVRPRPVGAAIPARASRPLSLAIAGLLQGMGGASVLGLTVAAVLGVVIEREPLSMLVTWASPESGATWPLGLLMIGLAPMSLVTGSSLMADGPRRPALLVALGWVLIDGLFALETGHAVPLGFQVLPVPFLVWGTLVEARRLGGLRAALAA